MSNFFTYKDDTEGKVSIGKLPDEFRATLDKIANEYYALVPDKNVSTHHMWYNDIPPSIKQNIETIQKSDFWNKLCDGTDKCIKINAYEMDELYYSNPQNNLDKTNLYGAKSNYDIHRDCLFRFNGIKFYRVIIGLTDGNDNIITYFSNLNVGHKINKGDYIAFDFDRSTHQVIKEKQTYTPRIMLKMHYIVCENCEYSRDYVEFIKQFYLWYDYSTRWIMKTGTDPKTFFQFFWGLVPHYLYTPYVEYILPFVILCVVVMLKVLCKVKMVFKNWFKILSYTILALTCIYLTIVFFYWARFQLFGIR